MSVASGRWYYLVMGNDTRCKAEVLADLSTRFDKEQSMSLRKAQQLRQQGDTKWELHRVAAEVWRDAALMADKASQAEMLEMQSGWTPDPDPEDEVIDADAVGSLADWNGNRPPSRDVKDKRK